MRGGNLEGVALRVTGTVPLPLGDPSTQRSMNRVVAQQELERQNFRVRGSGGDAVFSANTLRGGLGKGSSENSKANRIETRKGPAESGQICSVGRRKIAKKIAKNKRCYANTLRPRSRMLLKVSGLLRVP